MSIIYQKSNISITLEKNKSYNMLIQDFDKYKNYHNNILKILKDYKYISVTSSEKNKEQAFIKFESSDVIPLKELLKSKQNQLGYKQSETLFISLSNQTMNLEKDMVSNLFFSIDDIVVINSSSAVPIFLYLNTQFFSPIEDNFVEISSPFMKNKLFISPELKELKDIPSKIHFKSTYYSIGLLICFCINREDFKTKDLEQAIGVILHTKLYFALKRCFEFKPSDRFLLYI
jgi:hypothetical protein|uniref:Uncharacterized protein n=1 Tax=viral metagenome TaxID=1070528 RepID=A0A6C0IS41_9ZZZZ